MIFNRRQQKWKILKAFIKKQMIRKLRLLPRILFNSLSKYCKGDKILFEYILPIKNIKIDQDMEN